MTGPAQLIVVAGLVGGLAIWLRAAMLKPTNRAWPKAPSPVSLSLAVLGIMLMLLAFAEARSRGQMNRADLELWLALLAASNAVTGLVMLVNLWIQQRPPPEA